MSPIRHAASHSRRVRRTTAPSTPSAWFWVSVLGLADAVELEDHDRDRLELTAGGGDPLLHDHLEELLVEQTGHRVDELLPVDRVDGELLLGVVPAGGFLGEHRGQGVELPAEPGPVHAHLVEALLGGAGAGAEGGGEDGGEQPEEAGEDTQLGNPEHPDDHSDGEREQAGTDCESQAAVNHAHSIGWRCAGVECFVRFRR